MAFLTALISKVTGNNAGSKRVGIGNPGSVLLVDVTVSDSVSFEAELTSHPVERGLDVTDHILVKPRKIEIEGIASEAPLQLRNAYSEKGLLDQAADAVGGVSGAVAQKFGGSGIIQGAAAAVGGIVSNKLFAASQTPGQQAKEALIKILEEKTPINIQIAKKNYPNMVLVSLSFPRDPALGQAVRFRASFQQIRKVSAKRIVVKAARGDVRHTAGQADSLGNQNATPADAATTEKASLLYQLGQAAGAIQ
jgi:hypothetical protein